MPPIFKENWGNLRVLMRSMIIGVFENNCSEIKSNFVVKRKLLTKTCLNDLEVKMEDINFFFGSKSSVLISFMLLLKSVHSAQ